MKSVVDDNFRENLSWEEKAKINPLYAVMSSDAFKDTGPDKWSDAELSTFFAKGKYMYDLFLKPILERNKVNKKEEALIVEYGSGMGRILKAINAAGYKSAGIDISPTMLEYSRKLVPEVPSLFCLDEKGSCDIISNSADFVYSYAVIQHIRKLSLVEKAISEMCRILKPGGFLKVQYRSIPGDLPFRRIDLSSRLLLYNFEDKSVLFQLKKIFNLILLPYIRIYYHNNWLGVPLSFGKIQKFLNRYGVAVVGIEEDVGKKGNMFWMLGKKRDSAK
jgi:SAM-dependent methyltransferase